MVTMVTVMVLAVAFGRFLHLKLSCKLSAVDIRLQAPPVPAVARGLAPHVFLQGKVGLETGNGKQAWLRATSRPHQTFSGFQGRVVLFALRDC